MKKGSASLSLGGKPIKNVSMRVNAPFVLLTNNNDSSIKRSIVYKFILKKIFLIEITFQNGSPPNKNGAELVSTIV